MNQWQGSTDRLFPLGLLAGLMASSFALPGLTGRIATALLGVGSGLLWCQMRRQNLSLAAELARQAETVETVSAQAATVGDFVPGARRQLMTTMTQLEASGCGVVSGISELAGHTETQMAGLTNLVSDSRTACEGFALTVLASTEQVSRVVSASHETLAAALDAIDLLVGRMSESAANQVRLGDVTTSLQAQTQAIRQIATTVGDIARQSSMLALNACIEAARSGHDGRGFAVVAEEFRRLSDETRLAATSIGDQVNGVEAGIAATVAAVAETTHLLAEHQQAAATAGESLYGLRAVMDEVSTATTVLCERATAFSSVQEDLKQGLSDMASQAEAAQNTVFNLFEHLQFSDICRQGIDRVQTMIDDLESTAAVAADAASPPAIAITMLPTLSAIRTA